MSENLPETENAPLDTEDWEICFAPYTGHPDAVLTMGFNLMVLKSYLCIEPLRIQEAIDGIDRAVDVLFPHTDFHNITRDLFRKVIEGKLTLEEEQTLKALGAKF